MIYTGRLGTNYRLDTRPLASGGEGNIYRVIGGTKKKVAKIYHDDKLTQELENKLKYMVDYPPDSGVFNQVAWPLDVLYDTNNQFCGFVMPKLNVNAELREIYQYPSTSGLSVIQKATIAQNICAVISAVHNAGYVFGDFNPRNIGVDKSSGKVAFLDTDSYHVFNNSTNRHYRCKVCADGYAAPELLEVCANHAARYPNDSKQLYEKTPLPTFTIETDNFALAIHIFKLLMNGFTPFGGIIETVSSSLASPSMGNAAIRRNEYSFRPGYKPLSPAVLPLDVFPQEIADLFTRAFLVIGKVNPKQRPTSVEWHQALSRYETTLVSCSRNNLHQYDKKNATCPLCEADKRYHNAINATTVQTPTPLQTPVLSPIPQKTYSTSPPISGWQSLSSFTKSIIIVISTIIILFIIDSLYKSDGVDKRNNNDTSSSAAKSNVASPTPKFTPATSSKESNNSDANTKSPMTTKMPVVDAPNVVQPNRQISTQAPAQTPTKIDTSSSSLATASTPSQKPTPIPKKETSSPMPQFKPLQNETDISNLSVGERGALSRACSRAQSQGLAAYNQCVREQVAVRGVPPNISNLSVGEHGALSRVCSNAQGQGLGAYNQCIREQVAVRGVSPNISNLSVGEHGALNRVCSNAQGRGLGAYNQCIREQVAARGVAPNISNLSVGEHGALSRACSNAQGQGLGAYNQCVRQQLVAMGR